MRYRLIIQCTKCGEQGTPISFDNAADLSKAAAGLADLEASPSPWRCECEADSAGAAPVPPPDGEAPRQPTNERTDTSAGPGERDARRPAKEIGLEVVKKLAEAWNRTMYLESSIVAAAITADREQRDREHDERIRHLEESCKAQQERAELLIATGDRLAARVTAVEAERDAPAPPQTGKLPTNQPTKGQTP